MVFVDERRSEGHAVESICRVLCEQGCQVAARTYREWKHADRQLADRVVTDAHVANTVRDIAWTTDPEGRGKLAPRASTGGGR